MPAARLLAMIAFACLVALPACERKPKADAAPRKTFERSMTIWSQPKAVERLPPSQEATPAPSKSRPAMSLPPAERVNETRAPAQPKPAPAAPTPPPSGYQDGCGRPLIS